MYEPLIPPTSSGDPVPVGPPGNPPEPPAGSGAPTEPAAPVWTPQMFEAPVGGPTIPPMAPTPVKPADTPPPRRTVGIGSVIGAAVLAAALASGGTYIAVDGGRQTVAPSAATATVVNAPGTTGTAPAATTGGDSLVNIVKAVSPAVVTIVADGITSTDPTTGQTGVGSATGSGVIFDSNGLILTNRHVVSGNPQSLTVNLADGRSFPATIYGIDTLTDLAIVKVDQTGLPTAPIGDSSTIQVGQEAIAIGSPLGTFTGSVTSGIISALGRSIPVENEVLTNLIQTDTAINPGNSGGPLLDPSGSVIGINTAGASQSQGIGFAIPIDIARPLLAQATAGQPLARPWLGIMFQTIDPTIQQANGLPVANGAWIPTAAAIAAERQGQGQFGGSPQASVVAGSPADQAGLQPGDIITAVNGTTLDATHPLDIVTSQFGPGQSVPLSVLRDGQTIQLTVTLGTRPATT